jgi:hypothetical protein
MSNALCEQASDRRSEGRENQKKARRRNGLGKISPPQDYRRDGDNTGRKGHSPTAEYISPARDIHGGRH